MGAKPLRVLLVEDNPGDVRLAREAFRDSAVPGTLDVVKDGVDAIEYLRKAAASEDEARGDDSAPTAAVARPGLVLLDLNLPRKDGRQVLAEVKSHPPAEVHPGGCPFHVQLGARRRDLLRPARQRVRDQALRPG